MMDSATTGTNSDELSELEGTVFVRGTVQNPKKMYSMR